MKRTILILLSIICCQICFAQVFIKGKIVDYKSNKPIGYATIHLIDAHNIGTISNEDGEFELVIKNHASISLLEVNHILYETKNIKIDSIKDHYAIKLNPAKLDLPTAIADGKYAQNLFLKAIAQLEESEIFFSATGFYRQLSQEDTFFTEVLESFADINYSNHGINGWQPKQGRYARTSQEKKYRYTNFSFFTRGFKTNINNRKSKKQTILHPSFDQEKYHFNPEQHIYKDDQEIAVIHCETKTKYKAVPHLEAKYFIDTKTFNILRIEGTIPHDLGANFRYNAYPKQETKYNIIVNFRQTKNLNCYVLDFIKAYAKFTLYPLKESNSKKKFSVNSIFYCYNSRKVNAEKRKKIKLKIDDLATISKMTYDVRFWRDNSIVKKTPIETKVFDDFERNGFNGNYFNE